MRGIHFGGGRGDLPPLHVQRAPGIHHGVALAINANEPLRIRNETEATGWALLARGSGESNSSGRSGCSPQRGERVLQNAL